MTEIKQVPIADGVVIYNGDCREVLATLEDASVDSVVCDPPYGLGKEPDMAEVLGHWIKGDDWTATGGGFMGKSWDEVHRVVIPDCRFENEARFVVEEGGQVWRIHRPGVGPLNDHPSETALDDHEFDRHIHNDKTIAALHEHVDWLMEGLL